MLTSPNSISEQKLENTKYLLQLKFLQDKLVLGVLFVCLFLADSKELGSLGPVQY